MVKVLRCFRWNDHRSAWWPDRHAWCGDVLVGQRKKTMFATVGGHNTSQWPEIPPGNPSFCQQNQNTRIDPFQCGYLIVLNQRFAINFQALFVPGQQFVGDIPPLGRRAGGSTITTTKRVVLTHVQATIPLKQRRNSFAAGGHGKGKDFNRRAKIPSRPRSGLMANGPPQPGRPRPAGPKYPSPHICPPRWCT